MRTALVIVVSAVLGAIVALVGGVAHRGIPPFGVILSVLLVLVATVFVRTWARWLGVLAFVIPYLAITFIFTQEGPNGSLLIAADGLGYGWLYGGAAAIVVASVLPVRLLGGGRPAESNKAPEPALVDEGEAGSVAST
jgi:hypothetical protein